MIELVLRNKKKKMSIKRALFIIGMIILPVLNFIVFYFIVNVNSILMAFQMEIGGSVTWTLENFRMMFAEFSSTTMGNNSILLALKNTLIFFATSLLVVLPLTIIIAYFLYRKVWGYKFFRIIFFFPSIISAVVLTMLYSNIVGVAGPIAPIIQKLTGQATMPELLGQDEYALATIVVFVIWTGFGTNLILLNGAMARIPVDVVEAGKLDGVSRTRELLQIILPMIWPTLTTLITFAFIGLFTASGPILLFTKGDYKTTTISYWIFDKVYNSTSANMQSYASSVGLFFTLIALPIVLIVRKLMNKLCEAVEY